MTYRLVNFRQDAWDNAEAKSNESAMEAQEGYAAEPDAKENTAASNTNDPDPAKVRQQIAINALNALNTNPHGWDYNKRVGDYPPGTDKCNKFVYDMISTAGADPGKPNGSLLKRAFGGGYPPTSEQWADRNYFIPNWRLLRPFEMPQAGDVVAEKIAGYQHATGHSGIVVGFGQTVSVALVGNGGQGEILTLNNYGFRSNSDTSHGGLGHYSKVVFRRYEPMKIPQLF